MHDYLTNDLPGTGGIIKEDPEDFLVEEIPLYVPAGSGEHTFATIEKRGLTTLEAIRRITCALGISDRDIGYAGMKDARGVTRQSISLTRVDPARVLSLDLPGVRVLSADLHRNKLKVGHLAGNRFRIRIRGAADDALERAEAILSVLRERGVPNFFGSQRYGAQGNSHRIGRAILAGDYRGAVDALMGDPAAIRDERWQAAINAYHRGELAASLATFPGHCRTERDVLQRLIKVPGDWERAFRAVHPRLKTLYLSALQSSLFDGVVASRLSTIDRVFTGDVAWKHENGACFLVENEEEEGPRAVRFEISPTGPLFGNRMKMPAGNQLAIEEAVLGEAGLSRDCFERPGTLHLAGERRPLRVPVGVTVLIGDGNGLVLEFSLPRGAYATAVMREIMKPDSHDH